MPGVGELEGEPSADPLTAQLDEILDSFAAAVVDATPTSDPARIDRIARLEKLRAATAALQIAESVRFAQSQVKEQMAAKVHPEVIGRGIAEQIGLACRISPTAAARRLSTARALWFELPDTYSELVAGALPERVAETVVSETRHLDAEQRRSVDDQLQSAGISRMGVKSATSCIRKAAYEVDPDGYLKRGRTERTHRRVGIRPAPDTMAVLSGYLPVNKVSPATRHSASTPTRQWLVVTAGAGIRSWPTPWWNASPAKPLPPMSTWSCKS